MNGSLLGVPMQRVIFIMGAVLGLSILGIIAIVGVQVATHQPIQVPPVLDDVTKMSLTALAGLLAGTRGTAEPGQTTIDAPAGSTVSVEPPAK
jgi:hypothetical protein